MPVFSLKPFVLFALSLSFGAVSSQPALAKQAPIVRVSATQPAAQSSGLYEVAKGGFSIPISGSYPQGYAPSWKIAGAVAQPIAMDRYNVLNHYPQGTETLLIRFTEDEGHTVFEFARKGTTPCIADVVGLPKVITATPVQITLTNFRYANNLGPQCQRTVKANEPWKGSITLSANPDGDLTLSLVLDLALMPAGNPWFHFTAQNFVFPNQMTPQMAAADIAKKQEIAAAAAERERAAAAARAEMAAKIAALPKAGPLYTSKLAEYVHTDSLGWAMYKLQPGSVGNVRLLAGTVKSGNFLLRGEFKYVGGSDGWVVVKYSEGKFNCIEFWDSMVGCRPLRKPGEGQATVMSLFNGAADSTTSSGNNNPAFDANARWGMYLQNKQTSGEWH